MSKLFNTFLVAVSVLFFVTTAYAQEKDISWYVPQRSGGGAAALQTILAEELTKRGWNVDFKVIGNCSRVKAMMQDNDSKNWNQKNIIAGWGADYQSSPNASCYIEQTKNNFVVSFATWARLVCGPLDNPGFSFEAGKSYKIGVNAGQGHGPAIEELGKVLGVDAKAIEYKNSGAIKKALAGGEIDAWYTTAGFADHIAGKRKCLYTSTVNELAGMKPLHTLITNSRAYASITNFATLSKSVKPEVKATLTADLKEILVGDAFQAILKKRGGTYDSNESAEDAIANIAKTSKAYAK